MHALLAMVKKPFGRPPFRLHTGYKTHSLGFADALTGVQWCVYIAEPWTRSGKLSCRSGRRTREEKYKTRPGVLGGGLSNAPTLCVDPLASWDRIGPDPRASDAELFFYILAYACMCVCVCLFYRDGSVAVTGLTKRGRR